jgi:hypothetical protein
MSTLLEPTKSAQALYAKFLVRERTRAGLTQAELAAHPRVIVSSQTIGHIENCRRPPTIRLRWKPDYWGAPSSIGTPTREPYSVQEPS